MREEFVSDNQKPCEGVSLRASHSSVLGAKAIGGGQSPESTNTESEGLLDSFVQEHIATPNSASCVCVRVYARVPMCVRDEIRGQPQTLVFTFCLWLYAPD